MILAYAYHSDPRGWMVKDKFYSFFCLNSAETVIFIGGQIILTYTLDGELTSKVQEDFVFWMWCLVVYGYATLACFCTSCLMIVGIIGLSLASGTFNTKRYDEHYKEVMAKQKEEQEEMKTAFSIKNGDWADLAFKVGDYLQYSEFDDAILYMKPN